MRWPKETLTDYGGTQMLPGNVAMNQDTLLPRIKRHLAVAGAKTVLLSKESISFRDGSLSPMWHGARTVTGGEVWLERSAGQSYLAYRVSFHDQYVFMRRVVLLLSPFSIVPVFLTGVWFLPFGALAIAVWWLVVVVLNIRLYRSFVDRFFHRVILEWFEEQKQARERIDR